jgi:hypothetical protein
MRLALAGNVLVPAPCRVPHYIVLTLVLYTDRSFLTATISVSS